MNKSRRLEIFEKLRQRNAGFLTAVLWKLTADRELFVEAMQIALLKIWQNAEKLDNNKKATAYIYRIALSANSQAWRHRIGKNGQVSLEAFAAEPAARQRNDNSDIIDKIRLVIAKLPSKQARAIVMRYFEQSDYTDIAEKLRCSEAAARSNVSKAIAALKKKLRSLHGLEY